MLGLAAAGAPWGRFVPRRCQTGCSRQPAAAAAEEAVHNINESFDKKEAGEAIVSLALFS